MKYSILASLSRSLAAPQMTAATTTAISGGARDSESSGAPTITVTAEGKLQVCVKASRLPPQVPKPEVPVTRPTASYETQPKPPALPAQTGKLGCAQRLRRRAPLAVGKG